VAGMGGIIQQRRDPRIEQGIVFGHRCDPFQPFGTISNGKV
jgi:hypothetical protein